MYKIRNFNLEDIYFENYIASKPIYENDAMVQRNSQNITQSEEPELGNSIPDNGAGMDDYDLRRAILKLQEWVMYIDHKFPDVVDDLGGMGGFLNEMANKMIEDEMIRPSGNGEADGFDNDEDVDYSQEDEEDINDEDIEYEVQNNSQQNQNMPQSFQKNS